VRRERRRGRRDCGPHHRPPCLLKATGCIGGYVCCGATCQAATKPPGVRKAPLDLGSRGQASPPPSVVRPPQIIRCRVDVHGKPVCIHKIGDRPVQIVLGLLADLLALGRTRVSPSDISHLLFLPKAERGLAAKGSSWIDALAGDIDIGQGVENHRLRMLKNLPGNSNRAILKRRAGRLSILADLREVAVGITHKHNAIQKPVIV